MRDLCSVLPDRRHPHGPKHRKGRHPIRGRLPDLPSVSNVLPGRCHHHHAGQVDTRCRLLGVNVKSDANKCRLIALALILILPPLVLLALGDYPRRSLLKETLSMLTLAAFFLMLGQFLLVRGARFVTGGVRFSRLLSLHKLIGYSVVSLLLAHPFMIVLPRSFEGGVSPVEALTKILTTIDSPGVVLGMISWVLMFVIGATSLLRERLGLDYRTWKLVHGLLSVLLVVTASWHAIDLGRHTNAAVSLLMVTLACAASLVLIHQYVSVFDKPEVRAHERSA